MSTLLAIRPISRIKISRSAFLHKRVSPTVASYLVGYNNHCCSLESDRNDVFICKYIFNKYVKPKSVFYQFIEAITFIF